MQAEIMEKEKVCGLVSVTPSLQPLWKSFSCIVELSLLVFCGEFCVYLNQ